MSNLRLRNLFSLHRCVLNSLSFTPVTSAEWAEVDLAGPLKFRVYEELLPYIDDKAIARPMAELSSIYTRNSLGYKLPASECTSSRRMVVEAMKRAGEWELLEEIRRFGKGEFVGDELIYYLKAKERQINAIMERMFGFTTPRYRLILGAMENQVADQIFPYLKAIALGDSEKQQHDRLENHRVQRGRSWPLTICLDFLKWCQNKDKYNTSGTSEVVDSMFDIGNEDGVRPYGSLHSFAEGCVFVPQKSNMPPISLQRGEDHLYVDEGEFYTSFLEALNTQIKDRVSRANGEPAVVEQGAYDLYFSDARLVEGQCQKFWTVDTLGDFLAVMNRLGYHGEISVQGDNLILFLYIPIPDSIPRGEEWTEDSLKIRDAALDKFELALLERSVLMNKPLKASETWSSSELAIFSKKFIWGRVILSQGLKQASKIGSESNDMIVSSNTRIGGIFSAASGAAHNSHDGTIYFLLAWARSAIEVCQEFLESSVDQRKKSTVSLRGLLPDLGPQDRVKWLIFFSLAMTSCFSFPPAISAYSLMNVKGSPDPASDALACIRICAIGGHKIAKAIIMYLSSEGLKRVKKADPVFLVDSPLSIPLIATKDISQLATDLTRRLIEGCSTNSPLVKYLMSPAIKTQGRGIKEALTFMTPHFCPKVASFISQNTLSYASDMLSKSCYSRSILKDLGGVPDSLTSEAVRMQEETMKARLSFINSVASHRANCAEEFSHKHAFEISRELRRNCVELEGLEVDGVTCPSPLEQMVISRRRHHDPLPKSAYGLISVNFSSLKGQDVALTEARGPGLTIHGSRTDDKMTRGVLQKDRYKSVQTQCVQLASHIKMITKPGTELDKLTDLIMRSQSDIGVEEGRAYTGCQVEGCTWHRLPNKVISSLSTMVPRGGITSFIEKTSDPLCSLTATSSQPMILFQGWFLLAYSKIVTALSHYRYEKDGVALGGEKTNSLSFLIFPVQNSWFEAYTGGYDLIPGVVEQIKVCDPHPIMVANLLEAARIAGGLATLPFIATVIPNVAPEVAAARVVYKDDLRQSYQLVANMPSGGLKPVSPVLKIGLLNKMSLTRVLDNIAMEMLVDDLGTYFETLGTHPEGNIAYVGALVGAKCKDIEGQSTGIVLAEAITSPAGRRGIDELINLMGPRYDVYVSKAALGNLIRDYLSLKVSEYIKGAVELPHLVIFQDEMTHGRTEESVIRGLKYMMLVVFIRGGPCCGDIPSRLGTILKGAQEYILSTYRSGKLVTPIEMRAALCLQTHHIKVRKHRAPHADMLDQMIRVGFPDVVRFINIHPRALLMEKFSEDEITEEGEDLAPGPTSHGTAREPIGRCEVSLPVAPSGTKTHSRFISINVSPDSLSPRSLTLAPTLGTNIEADPQITHMFKEHYYLSSASYKLCDILARAGIRPKHAICLADGAGGFAAFLARLVTTQSVIWQSLSRPYDSSTITGQQAASVPEEIVVLPHAAREKVLGISELQTMTGDLLDWGVIESLHKLFKRIAEAPDLITCDVKLTAKHVEGKDVVEEYYYLFSNVGALSASLMTNDGVLLIKAFLAVPAVVRSMISALSKSFRRITVMTSIFSSSSNTEVYFHCKEARSSDLVRSHEIKTFYSDQRLKEVLKKLRPELRRSLEPFPLLDRERAFLISNFMSSVFPSRVYNIASSLVSVEFSDLIARRLIPSRGHSEEWLALIDIAIQAAANAAVSAKREIISASCIAAATSNVESSRTLTMTQMRTTTGKSECRIAALQLLKRLTTGRTNSVADIMTIISALSGSTHEFRSGKLTFGVHIDRRHFSTTWARHVMLIFGSCVREGLSLGSTREEFKMLQAGGMLSDFNDIRHRWDVAAYIANEAFNSWVNTHKGQKQCVVSELFAGRGAITRAFSDLADNLKVEMTIEAYTDRATCFNRYMRQGNRLESGHIVPFYFQSTLEEFKSALNYKGIISLDIPWDTELEPYPGSGTFIDLCVEAVLAGSTVVFTAAGWSPYRREFWEEKGISSKRCTSGGRDIYVLNRS
eukprot:GHVU01171786.1.p1 GENE.GHVU01171786.1~~GHVU01171786.1.p1  ORF type:complete len:2100 (-),score=73.73 GHVU01171786.1:38-6061(-)